jgi:hypothetical protein
MINNPNNNSHKIPITCTLFHLKVQTKTTMKVYYKPSTQTETQNKRQETKTMSSTLKRQTLI